LLAAAALGLAGVVAGAKDKLFLLSGPTLLILVLSAAALIFSIQLAYHARKFLYSRQDVLDWYGLDPDVGESEELEKLSRAQSNDFKTWDKYNNLATRYFNQGTVLLGIGVAGALAPGADSSQQKWRWAAAGFILACTFGEIYWQWKLRRAVNRRAALSSNRTRQGGAS
jgi:hypothetical protein